jgi:hypothetical protein
MGSMRRITHSTVLVTAGLAAVPSSSSAQQTERNPLAIHGYFTQAAGIADQEPVNGIPENLTTDYRAAALQFRYSLPGSFLTGGTITLQLSHDRQGESLLNDYEEELELDWAYYQARLGNLRVRAGRFPYELGIYNQIRDVGTLIPFYKAPQSVYQEGAETMDGLGLQYDIDHAGWELEASLHGGGIGWRGVVVLPNGPTVMDVRTEKSVGAQLWIDTPLDDLEFGASTLRWHDRDFDSDAKIDQLSLNADFDRFMFRGEYRWLEVPPGLKFWIYYLQGGVNVWGPLRLQAQYESMDLAENATAWAPARPRYERLRDGALGLNYSPSGSVSLKLEAHRARGYEFDRWVSPDGPPAKTGYGLASVSFSF